MSALEDFMDEYDVDYMADYLDGSANIPEYTITINATINGEVYKDTTVTTSVTNGIQTRAYDIDGDGTADVTVKTDYNSGTVYTYYNVTYGAAIEFYQIELLGEVETMDVDAYITECLSATEEVPAAYEELMTSLSGLDESKLASVLTNLAEAMIDAGESFEDYLEEAQAIYDETYAAKKAYYQEKYGVLFDAYWNGWLWLDSRKKKAKKAANEAKAEYMGQAQTFEYSDCTVTINPAENGDGVHTVVVEFDDMTFTFTYNENDDEEDEDETYECVLSDGTVITGTSNSDGTTELSYTNGNTTVEAKTTEDGSTVFNYYIDGKLVLTNTDEDGDFISDTGTADLDGDGEMDEIIKYYSNGYGLLYQADNGIWYERVYNNSGKLIKLGKDINGDGTIDIYASV